MKLTRKRNYPERAGFSLLAAALLQACGGGGSPLPHTEPITPPPAAEARLQLHSAALNGEAERSDRSVLEERSAELSITGASTATRPHFKVRADGEALETASAVEWDAGTGQVRARIKLRNDLTPGLYSGQWTVSACHDAECQRHLSGSPRTLSYQHRVLPTFELSEPAVEFSGSTGEQPSATAVRVALPTQASGWTYQILDAPEKVSWLRHRANGAQLELQPVEGLAGGVYKAELQVSALGVDRPARTLLVKATIDPLVKVLYAPTFSVLTLSTQPAISMRVLATSQATQDLSWTARSDTPWLRLVRSSGGTVDPVLLELRAEAFEKLANLERHAASVEFSFSHGLPARTVNFHLVKRLSQVDSVDDSSLQAGRAGSLMLHGSDFNILRANLAQLLKFEGLAPTALQVLDNRRIQVDLPALAAGRYQARLDTVSGLPGQRIAFTVR